MPHDILPRVLALDTERLHERGRWFGLLNPGPAARGALLDAAVCIFPLGATAFCGLLLVYACPLRSSGQAHLVWRHSPARTRHYPARCRSKTNVTFLWQAADTAPISPPPDYNGFQRSFWRPQAGVAFFQLAADAAPLRPTTLHVPALGTRICALRDHLMICIQLASHCARRRAPG